MLQITSFAVYINYNKRKFVRYENLTGQKFHSLKVIKEDGRKHRSVIWQCQCDCGNIISVKASYLKKGVRKTCGCGSKGKNNHNWKGYKDISCRYWTSVKASADRRGISFNLSIKSAWNKFVEQNKKCKLTGLDLKFSLQPFKYQKEQTASLDRIDSNKGYTVDNIQWVHKKINQMKLCLRSDELLFWSKLIYEHNYR